MRAPMTEIPTPTSYKKLIEITVDLLIMKWMIFARIFIAISLVPAYTLLQQPPPLPSTGTCASIGYSTACCPQGTSCRATDGNCNCGNDCHQFSDCCSDVGCPRRKLLYRK